jgi:hypothetical protein
MQHFDALESGQHGRTKEEPRRHLILVSGQAPTQISAAADQKPRATAAILKLE